MQNEEQMILSEEEKSVILKMRAEKINQAKIDARDFLIQVIRSVTEELLSSRPTALYTMQTLNVDEEIKSEDLETISQIMDLMGLKFLALTSNRRAITFQHKKL
jgi:hypothetical protein